MKQIEILKAERESLRGGKRKPGRPPKTYYPRSAESYYERKLREMAGFLAQLSEEILIPRVAKIQESVVSERTDSKEAKLDVFSPDELDAIMGQIVFEFDRRYSKQTIANIIQTAGQQVVNFNRNQSEKLVSSFIGKEFNFGIEPYLTQEVLLFQSFNVNLIKSIPDQFKTRLTNNLLSQLQAGATPREIAKSIRDDYGVTRNRANAIARDQIGKFNGALDKVRFEQLGVDQYVWNTQRDARVRPEHAALHGKIRTWDQSPIPGEPINCRCFATAYFEDS